MITRKPGDKLRQQAADFFSQAAFYYRIGSVPQCKGLLERWFSCSMLISEIEKTPAPEKLREPESYFGMMNSNTDSVYPDVALLPAHKQNPNFRFPKMVEPELAPGSSPIEKLNYLASCWFARAGLLFRAGEIDQSKKALANWWHALNIKAEMENKEEPPKPLDPRHYFANEDGEDFPDSSSKVPLNPTPPEKNSSVVLPLPSVESDSDSV